MRKIVKMSVAAAIMMSVGSVATQAADLNIVDNVKVKGEIRARYESVEQDNARPDANALTNRLTIGTSADMFGTDFLSAYAEMTDVRSLNDNFNDLNGGYANEANSVVADPDQTRLTQAYLDLKFGDTKLRAGRQVINLDNQRFIGSVGWRQMFQTMDAYTLTNKSIENLDLFASYITQRNQVTTTISDTRDLLLHASYKAMPELKVTGYSYMLGSQHDTYGIALTGNISGVTYRAEYAKQTGASMEDAGQGGAKADATYYNLALGTNLDGFLVGAGYEVLSGDSDGAGKETAFNTPYSTLHAHNGWADVFLAGNGTGNQTAGLEDTSVYLGYKAKGFGLVKVVYHDFNSEVGSTDFGTEIDAIYKNSIPGVKGLSGMLKVADYRADALAVDTTKVWAMLDYKFSTK